MAANEGAGSQGEAAVGVWRFAEAELDERVFELRVRGIPVEVERTPLRVLRILVEHPRQAISHEALLSKVWRRSPDTLSRSALPNAIRKLRRALGDDEQHLIVSVAGEGYMLAADVERKELPPLPSLERVLKAGQAVPHRPDWRLLERIDATDSSEVWLAEHQRNRERRVFKFAGDGFHLTALRREVTIGRLLQEALGDRPEFVRIHDWNLDAPPYFIECDYGGVDLRRWSEAKGSLVSVPLQDRLDLAVSMAQALATAHAVGVLHKDLKPANVLLDTGRDGGNHIRLADFGSGRLLEPEMLDQYQITRVTLPDADPTGTPIYLAPELLAGEPPTTASDIYALGVMLYQLMVGDFRRPIAQGWETEVTDALLREDITAATHGNPQRRIAAAKDLAERLRTLPQRRGAREQELTLQAKAEAAQKALERSKAQRPWVTGVIVALLLGLGTSLWFYYKASVARDQAQAETARVSALNKFVTNDILLAASPIASGKGSMTVKEAVDQAVSKAPETFRDQPDIEAEIHSTIAKVYGQLYQNAAATAEEGKAAQLYKKTLGPNDSKTLLSELFYVGDLANAGKLDDARAQLDEVGTTLSTLHTAIPDVRSRYYNSLGMISVQSGRFPAAVEGFERALDYAKEAQLPPLAQLRTKGNLGYAYMKDGQYQKSADIDKDVVDGLTQAKGPNNQATLSAEAVYLTALILAGHADQVLPQAEKLLEICRKELGDENPITADANTTMMSAQDAVGNYAEAARFANIAYNINRKRNGDQDAATIDSLMDVGRIYLEGRETDKAIATMSSAVADRMKVSGTKNRLWAADDADLTYAMAIAGRTPESLKRVEGYAQWPTTIEGFDDDLKGRIDLINAQLALNVGDKATARKDADEALSLLPKGDPTDFHLKAAQAMEAALK